MHLVYCNHFAGEKVNLTELVVLKGSNRKYHMSIIVQDWILRIIKWNFLCNHIPCLCH